MKEQITILKGSPRKNGNTNAITYIIEDHLRKHSIHIEAFDLHDMNLLPCTAYRYCQKDWSIVDCIQNDDFTLISDAVINSQMFILSTPIYSWYCTPPMKALLDRMVYAFNMYYGESRGPSLWEGKRVSIITTCGYPPEKVADLFEEGIKRYCKHSKLSYTGMLSEHHKGYHSDFMDDDKIIRAKSFAEQLLEHLGK